MKVCCCCCFQEAIEEDRTSIHGALLSASPPGSHKGLVHSSLTPDDCIRSQKRQSLVSPFVSPACSMEFLNELDSKPFREFVFSALPIVVHPIIVLRVIAHKLFGNMIRRKTKLSKTRLQPPKVLTSDFCPPPVCSDESDDDGQKEASLSKRRKASSLHVHIASPAKEPTPSQAKPVAEKDAAKLNTTKSKNGTTKLALRAIGESLVTPLEFNIGQTLESPPSDNGATTILPENAIKSSSSKKLFRWSSKKRLSKSHVNVSAVHRDSVASQGSQLSHKGSSSSSTPDVDVIAFQRELINLPTFVMDTPNADISPVFSRSSSVPDNLASRGGIPPLENNELVLQSTCNSTPPSALAIQSDQLPSLCDLVSLPKSGSVVTITTTDVDSPSLPTAQMDSDSADEKPTNILVHFEAPASPGGSSPSQSPNHVFEFPSLPTSSSFNINQLYPGRESALTSAANLSPTGTRPNQLAPNQLAIMSPTTSSPSGSEKSPQSMAPYALKSTPVSSPTGDIPLPHKGIIRVMETWINICKSDLECGSLISSEMKDFLTKLSVLGHEYKAWCYKISNLLQLEVSTHSIVIPQPATAHVPIERLLPFYFVCGSYFTLFKSLSGRGLL